jgi:hypothetical protein
MKNIFYILLLLVSVDCSAQQVFPFAGNDTSVNGFNGLVKSKGAFVTGTDTGKVRRAWNKFSYHRFDTGSMVVQDGYFFYFDGAHWQTPAAAVGGVTFVNGMSGNVTLNSADIPINGDFDLNNTYKIINSPNPVNAGDVVNLSYLNQFINGVVWKDLALVATTAALPANTYNNGASGVGATLTMSSNGRLSNVDGYRVPRNGRILVKDEADTTHDGIYSLTDTGTTSTPARLTRTTDANTAILLTHAAIAIDTFGVTNKGKAYTQVTSPLTIGTSPIVFIQFLNNVYTAGYGLSLNGQQFSVDTTILNYTKSIKLNASDTAGLSNRINQKFATSDTAGLWFYRTTVIPIADGGTGSTTRQEAIDTLMAASINDGKIWANVGGHGYWATPPTTVGMLTNSDGSLILFPSSGTGTIVDLTFNVNKSYHFTQPDTFANVKADTVDAKVSLSNIYPLPTTGTVTSVTAAYGLNGGTITSTGTVSVDTSRIAPRNAVDTASNNVRNWVYSKGYGTGTVNSVLIATANGFAGSVSGSAISTITMSVTPTSGSILKSTSTGGITAAVAGTDYMTSITAGNDISIVGTTSPTVTAIASVTPTASKIAKWDASVNMSANNFIEGYATTATAAATTTLTVTSARLQYFTGTTTQTVKLPVTSTLVTGHTYVITNSSTGLVTVNSSGSNAVQVIAPNATAILTCIGTSLTTAADWSVRYMLPAPTVNTQSGTTYTILASDIGKTVEFTNASAVTVTLPSGLGANFWCTISQNGTGQVTLTASGTTINNASSLTKTRARYSQFSIRETATTDTYITQGDMQ